MRSVEIKLYLFKIFKRLYLDFVPPGTFCDYGNEKIYPFWGRVLKELKEERKKKALIIFSYQLHEVSCLRFMCFPRKISYFQNVIVSVICKNTKMSINYCLI